MTNLEFGMDLEKMESGRVVQDGQVGQEGQAQGCQKAKGQEGVQGRVLLLAGTGVGTEEHHLENSSCATSPWHIAYQSHPLPPLTVGVQIHTVHGVWCHVGQNLSPILKNVCQMGQGKTCTVIRKPPVTVRARFPLSVYLPLLAKYKAGRRGPHMHHMHGTPPLT